jgi:hypothetical protein
MATTTSNNNVYNVEKIKLTVNDKTDPNKYFNNYFQPTIKVNSNIDAAILAYFETVTSNKESAKVLASAVIYTSYSQGVNPMKTLEEFTKLPAGQLNSYLVMFLNLQRKGTSYLGLTNQPVVNKYVNRAILP